MTKQEWKWVAQVRIELDVIDCPETEHVKYSFPIHCPRWLFNVLSKLEI